MNFSKTDETFGRASFDESARKALLQKMKKNRKVLVWIFWGNVAFLLAAAILCLWQIAPILHGNFSSFNPSLLTRPGFGIVAIAFSGMLGVFSAFGLGAADNRVKMLILIDSLAQKPRQRTQSEHEVHPNA